ncbi:hypothetical protein [Hymenobacter segetis]|uniref:Lipoprotein n=1 Tax=Hymenobacter segetis TaxID=2025509 RepID=A0ABU9LW20_9BACT
MSLVVVGCSKKSDAEPAIPANSIQLSDNGQVVVFGSPTAVVETNALGVKQLTIDASTADNHQISLSVTDRQGVETPRTYRGASAGSAYTLPITNYSTNCRSLVLGTQLYRFYIDSAPDLEVVVKSVDTSTHTVSGTFSGIYTLGCDSRKITNGQFNLPYTVKP